MGESPWKTRYQGPGVSAIVSVVRGKKIPRCKREVFPRNGCGELCILERAIPITVYRLG